MISTLGASVGLEPAQAAPLRPAIAEAPDTVLADGRRHDPRYRDPHWGYRPYRGYYGPWYSYPRYYDPPPYYAPPPSYYYPAPRYDAPPPSFYFHYRN